MDYGFGAVFGCPAHDQRDLDFAIKYNLKIKTVVKPLNETTNFKVENEAYVGPGRKYLTLHFNGFKVPEESIPKSIEILEKKIRKEKINFRLKDWEFQDKDIGMSNTKLHMMKKGEISKSSN